MAKTYNTFTNVSTGDVYTAASHNAILQNLAGYRVPPMCLLKKDNNQALSNAAYTAITWSATEEIYDTDGMHSTSSNTSRITPTTAGIYLFVFNDYITATTTNHYTAIQKNGAAYIAFQATGTTVLNSCSCLQFMNGTTDYVEAMVYVEGAGRTLVTTLGVDITFQAAWLGQVS